MRNLFERGLRLTGLLASISILGCAQPTDGTDSFDYEYTSTQDDGIAITRYTGDAINVSIPSEIDGERVTSINEGAFVQCDTICSVTIPNSVTEIGDSAFHSCASLTTVTLGDSVTTIGAGAFMWCTKLTSITIPKTIISIGGAAFGECSSLESVTINATTPPTLGDYVFPDTNDNFTILVPVRKLDSYKRAWNTTTKNYKDFFEGLTKISGSYRYYFNDDGTVAILCYDGYDYELDIPSTLDGYTVTKIDNSAFMDCTNLTSITIPDSVTTIDNAAFRNCTSLISITIPDSVTFIGSSAFINCTSLTSITIPDSVTIINLATFLDCTNLTSITIPDSVTIIGENAFYNCDSLISITIPDSVTTIDNCVFMNCESLTSITLPDSVTTIGDKAFYYCRSLTSITIKANNPPKISDKTFTENSDLQIYVPENSVEDYKTTWKYFTDYITAIDD